MAGSHESLLVELLQQQQAAAAQIGIVQSNLAILLEDRGRASEARSKIYEKLEKIEGRVDALESKADHAAGIWWAMRALWVMISGGVLTGLIWLAKKLGLM